MEAIRAKDFGFTYAGYDEKVFYDVNMSVEEGAFCILTGEAGCGKTTFLRSMCPPLSASGNKYGSITLFGEDLSVLSDECKIGYVYQDPSAQIVCDKVWRELAFGLENMGMERLLMHRRVAEVASYFGLGHIFNQDCSSLSGGQKQTLNIASVIAMNPRILLLDEPTGQLDPIASRHLVDIVSHINRTFDTTVIVATHAPEQFADVATCSFRLEDGRMHAVSIDALKLDGENKKARYACGAAHPESKNDKCAISVREATFSYSKDDPDIFREVDLDIYSGEIISLVGANGCGKTTLLKLIAGVIEPQSGRVSNDVKDSQAYLPQDVVLLFSQDSVIEELMEWAEDVGYSLDDAKRIASKLGLSDRLEFNPFDLSNGQQEKLGIAKMILCDPQLLLFDEPSKGLDGISQMELANILMDIAREGRTAVIATHDLAFASRISNRMALVFDGRIACIQDSKSFCEGNLFYVPKATRFSELWDQSECDGRNSV